MKPIAKAEDIELKYLALGRPVIVLIQVSALAADITHILGKVIEFTPEEEAISVSIRKGQGGKCLIQIRNSGINLALNQEIVNACKHSTRAVAEGKNSTLVEVAVDLFVEPLADSRAEERGPGANFVPDYYAEIRKRLRSHFNKSDNLVESLLQSNPREAAFLKRVNELILSNLQNRQFDSNYLSRALHMSRTQLFRRLKPIIRQSPGGYIRTLKLQKAKELFETTDLRISEVAFQSGFETASHFTKVFTKQYGVKPSLFCRSKPKPDTVNGKSPS